MSDIEKFKSTLERISELTKQNRLPWDEDPNGNDAPWVKVGEHFIVLREGRNHSGSVIYRVSIEDQDEKVIDSFSDEDLGGPSFRVFESLFKSARRQAKGADKALDEVLKGLENL